MKSNKINKEISLILAVDNKNGLWKNWKLAWDIPEDIKYFQKITLKTKDKNKINAVLMWRKTWESIPSKFKPLIWRLNCILTKNKKLFSNTLKKNNTKWYSSISTCIKDLEKNNNIEKIFVIGWAFFYNEILKYNCLKKIYITKVFWDFNCDIFFNWIPNSFELKSKSDMKKENNIKFNFEIWKRK